MRPFYTLAVDDLTVIATYTGCGKTNAAVIAQLMIDNYHVDAIIFSGIAGKFVTGH